MVYMFNELSLSKVSTKLTACNLLEVFVQANITMSELGFEEIRLHENSLNNLFNIPLSKNYNIDNWLEDNSVREDIRTRFKELVTTFPLITENEIKETELYKRSEFFKDFQNQRKQVWGLGAAHVYDTIAISLETDEEWKQSLVEISHYYLNNEIEATEEKIDVRNVSSVDNIRYHENWWNKRQSESLSKSTELWKRRIEFFPNLQLCHEVEYQLKSLGISKMTLQVIERLRALNEYAEGWTSGSFNYTDVNQSTNLNISPESKTTLDKYGSLRKFTIPGQGKKVFDLHIKTGNLRIHLYPDNENRTIYIGYIGKHLRIASED